jgi:hypothetical protein
MPSFWFRGFRLLFRVFGTTVIIIIMDHAIAREVSCWFPMEMARIRSQVRARGDLWWTKWQWIRLSLSASVSPAHFHSSICYTFINDSIVDGVWSRYWQPR